MQIKWQQCLDIYYFRGYSKTLEILCSFHHNSTHGSVGNYRDVCSFLQNFRHS